MTWTTDNQGNNVWQLSEAAIVPTGCPPSLTLQDLITRCGGQTKAAAICGVHRQTVHHWHNGRSAPPWTAFLAMCRATKTDPARFI
jgi:hypothetical protein